MHFSTVSDAFESMAIDIDQKLCYTLDTVNTYMHRPCSVSYTHLTCIREMEKPCIILGQYYFLCGWHHPSSDLFGIAAFGGACNIWCSTWHAAVSASKAMVFGTGSDFFVRFAVCI